MKLVRAITVIVLVSFVLFSLLAPITISAADSGPGEPLSQPLPAWPDDQAVTYTVKPGDSLSRIALEHYGDLFDWPMLYAANTELIGPDPNRIEPEQVLRVPPLKSDTSYRCDGVLMTAIDLAGYRNISITEVEHLQANQGLTLPEICTMPAEMLARAISKAENPKPDHPGEALEFRLLQLKDETGYIPPDGYSKAAAHIAAMATLPTRAAGLNGAGSWTSLGPGNIGGRVRALVISPTNPSAMWLGSVSGGIWKTLDGGTSWQPVDDFMANLAVSTLALNPLTPTTMYAGTGEGFYNGDAIRGAGVFKSTDGGNTWTQLPGTLSADWYYVNRLAISPDGGAVLAATRSGIWRSVNGGASWSLVQAGDTADIDFDPGNSSKAIAGAHGIVYYSTNGGLTWTGVGLGYSRVELAYAPSSPGIVYASVNQSGGQIWKSADGGQSYTMVNTGKNYLGSQGWYNNVIWVNPLDANFVIVGGIDLWRSTDGGATLTKISQWWSAPDSAHADNHLIVAPPDFNNTTHKTAFFGNDGGLYRAADVSTVAIITGWQELNNALGVTQFYGAAGNPRSGKIIGGTQDNGTLLYSGDSENWTSPFGGDGGFSAADPTNPNYFYGEYVYLRIHRSTDGGVSSSYIYGGISDAGYNANFIAPFILDPNNPNTLLAGGRSLWRSTNVKASTPSWKAIKPSIGYYISAIAVAPGNSDIIWVGHNNGDVYMTGNGTAASPTWTQVDNNTPPLPDRYVMRLTVDPNDHNTVYATFGGFSSDNIYKTTDNGLTWSDATGSGVTGLPEAPVRSLVIHPQKSNWLYAGTEVGVFTSEDGGASWQLPHDGPANVSVDELFWMGQQLVAATHGRGLFSASPGGFDKVDLQLSKVPNASLAIVGEVLTYTLAVYNPNPTATLILALTDTIPAEVTFVGATNGGLLDGDQIVWSNLSLSGFEFKPVAEVGFLVNASKQGRVTNTVQAASAEFGPVSYQVGLNRCYTIFKDDHEGANSWSTSNGQGENSWQRQSDGGYSGDNYWFVADIGSTSDSYLDSPVLTATNSALLLRFFHHYDTEASLDGGVVEIKVNNGGWNDIGEASFIQNGYNNDGLSLSPLSGRPAFSGDSGNTYHETVADLSAHLNEGDTFQLRFREANDSFVDADGWYLDDVSLLDCGPQLPDLALSKTVFPKATWAGNTVTYTLAVSNSGLGLATGAVLSDVLAAGLTYVPGSASAGGAFDGSAVRWSGLTILPNTPITRTFQVTLSTILTGGTTITNLAGISSTEVITPQTSTVTVTLVQQADLALRKVVTPTIALPGQAITYTLTFSNVRPDTAYGVVISDRLPLSLTQVSVISSGTVITPQTGTRYIWDVADLGQYAGGTITITAILSTPLVAWQAILTNTAIITTATFEANLANNQGTAGLTIANAAPTAEAGPSQTVLPGETVTLDGSASSDPNDDPLSYLWRQDGGPGITLSSISAISPTFVAPAQVGLITFTLTVTNPGGLSSADVTTVSVTPTPALTMSKTVVGPDNSVENLALGSMVTYTIQLINSGTGPGNGLYLTDTLAGGTTFSGWLIQDTAQAANGILTWSGTLSPAYTLTLRFKALINNETSLLGKQITNVVHLTADNAAAVSDHATFSIRPNEAPSIHQLYLPVVFKYSEK